VRSAAHRPWSASAASSAARRGPVSRMSATQRGSSATGSLVSSAALAPSVERPTPTRGRRLARRARAFSSTASRSSVETGTPRRAASASSVPSAAVDALTVVRRTFIVMHDASTWHRSFCKGRRHRTRSRRALAATPSASSTCPAPCPSPTASSYSRCCSGGASVRQGTGVGEERTRANALRREAADCSSGRPEWSSGS